VDCYIFVAQRLLKTRETDKMTAEG
jgi:hypothetical protein